MQGWLCKSYRIELVAMRGTQVVQDEICENIMAHGAKIAQCIHYLPLHGGVTCCLQKHSWLRAWGPFTMNGDYIYVYHIYTSSLISVTVFACLSACFCRH